MFVPVYNWYVLRYTGIWSIYNYY